MLADTLQFDYHYGQEAEQYTFYRIPKLLFSSDLFRSLCCEAKLLYGLMLDRMSVSRKNNWIDENNRVYIIFTIEEIQEQLHCREQKACKLLKQLESCGLVEKRRLGLGRASLLYVKNFILSRPLNCDNNNSEGEKPQPLPNDSDEISPENEDNQGFESNPVPEPPTSQESNCDIHHSAMMNIKVQELLESQCSNTNSSNTDSSNMNLSYPSYTDGMDGRNEVRAHCEALIKENIEYDILVEQEPAKRCYLDELVSIMVDALSSQKEVIFVDGSYRPAGEVRKRLLSLDSEHLEYVQECLSENTTQVKNIKAYLLTCLWRAPETINHRYMMQVNHDFRNG